jgi:hypothetical protein
VPSSANCYKKQIYNTICDLILIQSVAKGTRATELHVAIVWPRASSGQSVIHRRGRKYITHVSDLMDTCRDIPWIKEYQKILEGKATCRLHRYTPKLTTLTYIRRQGAWSRLWPEDQSPRNGFFGVILCQATYFAFKNLVYSWRNMMSPAFFMLTCNPIL